MSAKAPACTLAADAILDHGPLFYDHTLDSCTGASQPMPFSITGHQYKSAVYYHTRAQHEAVLAVRAELAGSSPFASSLDATYIEEAGTF